MPLALGIMAVGWGLMASLIPGLNIVGRVAAWAAIIGTLSYLHLTTVRRLVFGEEAVDVELTRRSVRIPCANLDHVTLRAMPLGATLYMTFVTKNPPAAIRTRTGLISGEMLGSPRRSSGP